MKLEIVFEKVILTVEWTTEDWVQLIWSKWFKKERVKLIELYKKGKQNDRKNRMIRII